MSANYNVPPERWIPSHGLSFPVAVALASAGFLLAAGTVLIYAIDNLRSPRLSLAGLMFPIAIMIGLATFVLAVPISRRPFGVGLAANGVRIAYPGRRVLLEWADLMRLRYVGQGLVIFRALSDTKNRRGHAYQVSVSQARAILSDPRCPQISMSEDQRRLIFDH